MEQASDEKPKRRGKGPGFDPRLHGLNEAVNFDLQAIFVAVPKTGSSGIRAQIREGRPFLFRQPHLNLREIRFCLDTYFLAHALGRNRSFPTDATLVASTEEVRNRAARFFEGAFKFGSVRNPFSRTVSLWRRAEGVQTQTRLSFAQFCERLEYASDTCLFPTRHANQVDWLVDDAGRIGVDFVLKLKDREAGLAKIRDLTGGRLSLDNNRSNVNPASPARSYREVYDSASKARVAKLFEKDLDLLGYTF